MDRTRRVEPPEHPAHLMPRAPSESLSHSLSSGCANIDITYPAPFLRAFVCVCEIFSRSVNMEFGASVLQRAVCVCVQGVCAMCTACNVYPVQSLRTCVHPAS